MLAEKVKILVAVSISEDLRLIEAVLPALGYEIILAADAESALTKAKANQTNLILFDANLAKVNGFEVVRQLKADATTEVIPVVIMTTTVEIEERLKALEAGADDFLNKPLEKTELQVRVKSLLKVSDYYKQRHRFHEMVEAEVSQRTQALAKALEKIKAASLDTVYRLSRAAEYKDEDTGAHVQRMSHYTSAIARAMNFESEFVESILWASPMHDVGKIGTPDRILQKPGKLDPDEWVIMKQHTTIGAEILKDANADFMRLAADIALTHHEKWDGNGYPRGLKGVDIPEAGRIVALADVFDALTSDRVYRPAMPLEKALAIIREGQGSHFDPKVVDAFLAIEAEIRAELNWWKFIATDSTSEEADLSTMFDS